jgi:hypothetical protein
MIQQNSRDKTKIRNSSDESNDSTNENELTRLRRGENFSPNNQNPRVPTQEQRRNPLQEQRIKNEDEHRQRAPRVKNPNVVILEEVFDEENFDSFDQEAEIIQDESLESV